MNPEERNLLERALKVSEENNQLLQKIERTTRRAAVWGFVKVAIVVLPLIAGYIYLQPVLEQALDNFNRARELLNV